MLRSKISGNEIIMWLLFLKRILCYWPVKIFARCHARPVDPHKDLGLNPDSPVVYILESNSISDILTLEKLTRKKRLPNPFAKLVYENKAIPRVTFLKKVKFFSSTNHQGYEYEQTMKQWINLAHSENIDIEVLPVTILWSRNPGHEDEPSRPVIRSSFRKFFRLLFFGFDNLTIVSGPISIKKLIDHPQKKSCVEILARAAYAHFERRRKEFIGPKLPNRKKLIDELLHSPNIVNAIKKQAQESNKSEKLVQKEAYNILNEIVSNTSYHLLKCIDTILHLIWNKLYQGIKIHGAQRVRELIRTGHEIVYIPCHRSHMDYLLLMYMLFHEGLVVPHIAAGNNLNFFPINYFLPRCGAFYMRRKFKGDLLYTTIFREYLSTLFMKGYSTEFYIEGGRSRTGRTLPPRTGIVAMAVQTQLRGIERPISFVPVYLGYEKVMEVSSYMNELKGGKKEKENAWQLFNIFKRFKYYGRGYVGFAEPISLPTFLRDCVPNWRDDIDPTGTAKPQWLFKTVNMLSDEIVKRLNSAASLNGLNLCALALLSSFNHKLNLNHLARLLNFYIFILKSTPVGMQGSIPDLPGNLLLKQALELKPFNIEKIDNQEYANPSIKQVIYLAYFRNNILHFFALPALIATIIIVHNKISFEDIVTHTRNVFYFLRHELFCPVREDVLNQTIADYLHAFQLEEYVKVVNNLYSIGTRDREDFIILSNCIHANLIRYIVGFVVMNSTQDNTITLNEFIDLCVQKSKQLPIEITDNSPEFYDPVTFKVMSETFIKHQYMFIDEETKTFSKNKTKLLKLLNAVSPLLPEAILKSIGDTEEIK